MVNARPVVAARAQHDTASGKACSSKAGKSKQAVLAEVPHEIQPLDLRQSLPQKEIRPSSPSDLLPSHWFSSRFLPW